MPVIEAAASRIVREAQEAAEREMLRLSRARRANAHADAVFRTQLLHGRVLFWISVALTGSGLIASSIHFFRALRRDEAHDVRLTLDMRALKLRTSALGVVIFIASLAFVFGYMYFVFPVTAVSASP